MQLQVAPVALLLNSPTRSNKLSTLPALTPYSPELCNLVVPPVSCRCSNLPVGRGKPSLIRNLQVWWKQSDR